MSLHAKHIFLSLLLFMNPNLKSISAIQEETNITPHESMSSSAGNDSDCDYKQTLRTKQYNYFKNLSKYSPFNKYGTCGFVSLIQVLSYYDNFYDDNIIEEKYDKKEDNQSSFLLDSELISPGVEKGDYGNTYPTIQDTVLNTCSTDYQYELIRRYNKYYSTSDKHKDESTEYQTSFGVSQISEVVNNCLSVKPKSIFAKDDLTQEEYRSLTKSYIDKGIPVILNITTSKNTNHHAVVAYDYTVTFHDMYAYPNISV